MNQALIALLGLLAAAPAALTAGRPEAEGAFQQGLNLERQRQYAAALQQYQAALEEDASYSAARRQAGNCAYYLGDKARALQFYDAYLAEVPNDAAIRKLADSLRPKEEVTLSAPPGLHPEDPPRLQVVYSNLGSLALGMFNLGYNRWLFGSQSASLEVAALSLPIEGFTYRMLGGGLAWNFMTQKMEGWYLGPRVDYFSVSVSRTDPTLGPCTASGSALSYGGQAGYRWIFENGWSVRLGAAVESVNIRAGSFSDAAGTIDLGTSAPTYSGILPTGALELGYAF